VTAPAPEPTPVPRHATELFLTFAGISLQSFGGALAHIERTVVRRKRWMDARQFLGLYAISQVLPGPSGISFCVLLGDRFLGARGAAAAVAGFLLPPAVLVLGLTSLFQHYQHLSWVQGALHGMGAAAIGLIIYTVARMSRALQRERLAIAVAALTFVAVATLQVPVGFVMLSIGLCSVAWAWHVLG